MKAKKLYFIVIGILLIILGIVLWSYYNSDEEVVNNEKEIIPQEEISDEQLRNTIISLYYINKETKEIDVESRLIDVKKLLNNPYDELLKMWFEGPKNVNLKNNYQNNVKINNVKLENDCVIIDMSEDFITQFNGEDDERIKIINCIVKTLTELTEVNSVKILIDGEENKYFGEFNLSEKYMRINE